MFYSFKSCVKQLLLISLSTIFAGCAGQTELPEPTYAEIDSAIQEEISNENIPGAVVLIAKDDKVLYHKSYGHAQTYSYGRKPLADPVPMERNTIFDLASLTKVFATTYAIMLLVDQGEIDLDDAASKHVPELSAPDKANITVRHLLTHSSGLAEWKPVYYHAANKVQALRFINELPRKYPVGEARHYSDLGFMVLGYLVENVSGMPLHVFLDEHLYRRLNLNNTMFAPGHRKPGMMAATSHGNPFERRMVADDEFGYKCDENPDDFTGWREYTVIGEVNDGNAFHAHQGVAGHAGLFSTSEELLVLLNVILNRGKHEDERIIGEDTIAEFITKNRYENGLGWAMSPRILMTDGYENLGAFGHTGFTGTYALGVPELKLAIILLTNRQNVDVGEDGRYFDLRDLRRRVVEVVLKAHAD